MNIRQLEYFIVMAETQQITEAAQPLYIAQPPLSRSLQRLENELGVVLFTRTKKGIELTDTGKVLYEKGRLLLKNYKDMLNVIKETEEGVSGTVRIGTGYPTVPLLAGKILSLRKHYPAVEFNITQEDPDKLLDMLRKGNLDIMFSPQTVDDPELESIPLEPDPLILVVNRQLDPAPEEDSIPIEKLEGIPFCMLRNGDFYGYNEILINECQKHGFTPHIFCQCNSASTAMTLVAQGLGLSYQPKMVVDTMTSQNLYGKCIQDFENTMFPAILRKKDAYMSGALKVFLSLFRQESVFPSSLLIPDPGKEDVL